MRIEEDRLAFDVTAQTLARFVELSLVGVDAVFSDNYFDVPAGGVIRLSCPLLQDWIAAQASAALRVRSLYDSFA